MKKAFLLLALFSSFFAGAQSLKEALFSGKLKNDAGTVIRKGDDLSTKMDTVARKAPTRDTLAVLTAAQVADSTQKKTAVAQTATPSNTTATETAGTTATQNPANTQPAVGTEAAQTDNAAEPATVAEPEVPKPRSNRNLFKDYMVDLAASLKSDVMSSKKVKKGSYFVMVAYTIETDGKVTITNVEVDPKNEILQRQIKERMDEGLPQLNPELNSQGVARKINRTYSFTLDKE